jgi:hypothetical protein
MRFVPSPLIIVLNITQAEESLCFFYDYLENILLAFA